MLQPLERNATLHPDAEGREVGLENRLYARLEHEQDRRRFGERNAGEVEPARLQGLRLGLEQR